MKNFSVAQRIRILLFQMVTVPLLWSVEYNGKVFEKNSKRQNLLYVLKHTDTKEKNGVEQVHRVFTYPDGKVSVVEDYLTSNGNLQKFTFEQKECGEEGIVEIRDGRVYFTYTANGKTGKSDEKLDGNLVAGGTLLPFLQKNWDAVLKGDTLYVRFAVIARKETVGFKLFKTDEKKIDGEDAVVVKMKPGNFLISALVDPLYFTFKKDGSRLLELLGRTSPKTLVKDRWKDLDADIVFDQ